MILRPERNAVGERCKAGIAVESVQKLRVLFRKPQIFVQRGDDPAGEFRAAEIFIPVRIR